MKFALTQIFPETVERKKNYYHRQSDTWSELKTIWTTIFRHASPNLHPFHSISNCFRGKFSSFYDYFESHFSKTIKIYICFLLELFLPEAECLWVMMTWVVAAVRPWVGEYQQSPRLEAARSPQTLLTEKHIQDLNKNNSHTQSLQTKLTTIKAANFWKVRVYKTHTI